MMYLIKNSVSSKKLLASTIKEAIENAQEMIVKQNGSINDVKFDFDGLGKIKRIAFFYSTEKQAVNLVSVKEEDIEII